MIVIKDSECSRESPLTHGHPDTPVYGSGHRIKPLHPGKCESEYEKKMYLPELLPLEEYDLIIILFSAGKDSAAAFYKMLELGVPKSKIEIWHHDIDGGHPSRQMDWPVTQSYIRAFAAAEVVRLRTSWRVNGFYGELFRVGASQPVMYEDDGEVKTCRLSQAQIESETLRQDNGLSGTPMCELMLKSYGHRMMFPAKSGDLSRRWCSAYLKISVADSVIYNLEKTQSVAKVLIVSGERRGESAGRARYNEMELHRKNAPAKARRLVHQWRAVIDYSLCDVWEVCRRHNLTPHPCYTCGWNRCSCACCIFSLPTHWAGIRELFPDRYAKLQADERLLGFTLDNNKTLDEFVGNAESCVCRDNPRAIEQLVTGGFHQTEIYTPNWQFPAGAFKGSAGGPC